MEAILASVREEVAAAKLLGAGGGGYLMMFARDDAAALRIREKLTRHPPNEKARFVDFAISDVGLQITRS